MLFLNSLELILGLSVDSLEFVFVVFVDNVLNLLNVTRLELVFRFSAGLSDDGHLLWGLLPVNSSVSWGDFNLLLWCDDWVLNFGSVGASLSSFLGLRIGLFVGGWFGLSYCEFSILLILWLHSTLVKEGVSNLLLVFHHLSLSLSVVGHSNLFLIGILKIWIVSSSLLLVRVLFGWECVVIVLLLQGWSHVRLLILFSVNWLLFSLSGGSILKLWLSEGSGWVLISLLGRSAISEARFGSGGPGRAFFLLGHATSSALLHCLVFLISVIARSNILRLLLLGVSAILVSLTSLVIWLHIF